METFHQGYSQNVGWRLRTLRRRHNLTLVEVARLAGLDVSYLSRLERDALQNAKPKPDTISRVLDAMAAGLQEREAVYHIERPPLTPDEISAEIRIIAADVEDSPEAYFAGDEHWFLHYFNRSGRAALGLKSEEYARAVGVHMLHTIIDPANPRYYRIPDEDRDQTFRRRVIMFKINFAGEEFDDWYQQVVKRIYDFPWAAAFWENPGEQPPVQTIGRDNVVLLNPVAGKLRCRFELHSLVQNHRFFLASWTPLDEETALKMQNVRNLPEFSYSLEEVKFAPSPASAQEGGLVSTEHLLGSDFAHG